MKSDPSTASTHLPSQTQSLIRAVKALRELAFLLPYYPLVPFASHLWSLPHSHTCFSFPPLSILDVLQHERLTYFKKPPPIHPVYGDLKMNRMDEGKL